MKHETKTADITTTLAARKAATRRRNTLAAVPQAIDAGESAGLQIQINAALSARLASIQSDAALARIPAPRRTLAHETINCAEAIAQFAARLGERYSGETRYLVQWGDKADASTTTDKGDQYSRGCTYKKTDADHIVTLDPAGVSRLVEDEEIRQASARDGLPLIAYYPDGSAVWVRTKGKAIVSERGWIAGTGATCYHSVKSLADAHAKYARKVAAAQREEAARRKDRKASRRARLIARLCGGIAASISDAKALGYCEPGIRQFQARHGIGDVATLPQLVRTGNPSAVALALSIARKAGRRELARA
jgi:hypothetical protein